MLVQFRFKNFGPFKDEVELDMRAIKAYKEHPYNLINAADELYIKVASIYGANASGKSNIVDAYTNFREIVSQSFSASGPEKKERAIAYYYDPFLFDKRTATEDTEFEAIYHSDTHEYRYGFLYNDERISYEWLYRRSLESRRQSCIFERTFDEIKLGASVKKSCEKYLGDIDSDVLALSFFSRLKLRTTVFKDTVECIHDILTVKAASQESIYQMLNLYFMRNFDEEEKAELLSFLNAIDVGIKDIEVEAEKDGIRVTTFHEDKDGAMCPVPIAIESDGTKKAIAIYSLVKHAVLADKGLIIDELNVQLHPLLLKYIVDLFYNEETKGQLIYTTHDTTLMDKRYMRRDQIWFTEKNELGESSLYSLAEYKVRNDQSFEKGYLGGIYGGIPILKDFSIKER